MNEKSFPAVILTFSLLACARSVFAIDPMRIEGPELAELKNDLPDGGLPPVVGVRNVQVFRATRDATDLADQKGWTYNHHQDMACWKGKLYVAWENGQKDEDLWPGRELYSTSDDGEKWSPPRELFPEGVATSLRMYFFHAPNGRMLVIAGQRVSHDKLDEGKKHGAVVREIRADHTLGNIFTLILDPACKSPSPMFETSSDKGFVEACRQLLANRPFLQTQDYGVLLGDRRMKWNEVAQTNRALRTFGKAFSFFHRKDGALVGICKQGWTIVSTDEGETWSDPIRPPTLITNNAKVWGTKTPDGRYALVYNPKPSDRFPLAMVSGDDGITFDSMRIVHGEVPRQRYEGLHKNIGPQYVRGISEWATDGSRKDDALWVVYSVNKEDIWVSRLPMPAQETGWSTYSPKWAPVTLNDDGSVKLEDRDPYDYAKATYSFADSPKVSIQFQIEKPTADDGTLNVEVQSRYASENPFRLALPNQSCSVVIELDAKANTSSVTIDGNPLGQKPLPAKVEDFQRISFQTGEFGGVGKTDPVPAGSDKPLQSPARAIVRKLEVR